MEHLPLLPNSNIASCPASQSSKFSHQFLSYNIQSLWLKSLQFPLFIPHIQILFKHFSNRYSVPRISCLNEDKLSQVITLKKHYEVEIKIMIVGQYLKKILRTKTIYYSVSSLSSTTTRLVCCPILGIRKSAWFYNWFLYCEEIKIRNFYLYYAFKTWLNLAKLPWCSNKLSIFSISLSKLWNSLTSSRLSVAFTAKPWGCASFLLIWVFLLLRLRRLCSNLLLEGIDSQLQSPSNCLLVSDNLLEFIFSLSILSIKRYRNRYKLITKFNNYE